MVSCLQISVGGPEWSCYAGNEFATCRAPPTFRGYYNIILPYTNLDRIRRMSDREKVVEKALRRLTSVFIRKLNGFDIRHDLYGKEQLTWMENERIGLYGRGWDLDHR